MITENENKFSGNVFAFIEGSKLKLSLNISRQFCFAKQIVAFQFFHEKQIY